MAEKVTGKELTLSQLISRGSLRIGRKLKTATGDELTRVAGALSLLAQAQTLISVDPRMARRLLEKANNALE